MTGGFSKPLLGSPTVARIDMLSGNFSSAAAGTLRISLTDTDFGPIPGQDTNGLILRNEWGGTTDGSITAQGYLGFTNTEFDTGGATTGLQGPLGPGAFADTVSVLVAPFGGAFSLTEIVEITHTAKGPLFTSFDKSLTAVPEPSIMLLLGSGLIALGLLGRKRRT